MLFNGREYYVVSIIIILISVAAFMWSFEKRKPAAREVVVLAAMTSIAVAGRMLFFMIPQFKPSAAIIIITGIMLGKQAGFLCGALTAFASDFFFGQGPWTPWQMIAFGIIGFLSACIFKDGGKRNSKVAVCVYGFLVTFVVYGLIMDTSTVFMYTDKPTAEAFIATYAGGIVFNAIHGLSTVVFLAVLFEPFVKKIKRIKYKYGMFKPYKKS